MLASTKTSVSVCFKTVASLDLSNTYGNDMVGYDEKKEERGRKCFNSFRLRLRLKQGLR